MFGDMGRRRLAGENRCPGGHPSEGGRPNKSLTTWTLVVSVDAAMSTKMHGRLGGCLAWTVSGVHAAPGPAGIQRLREKFPTGALAALTFATAWRELGRGSCYLNAVVSPRELQG